MLSISALDWCSQMAIPIVILGSDGRLISCHMPAAAPDGPLKRAQAIVPGVGIAQGLLRVKLESQARRYSRDVPGPWDRGFGVPSCAARHPGDPVAHRGAAARHRPAGSPCPRRLRGAALLELLSGEQLPWEAWAMKRVPDNWLRI